MVSETMPRKAPSSVERRQLSRKVGLFVTRPMISEPTKRPLSASRWARKTSRSAAVLGGVGKATVLSRSCPVLSFSQMLSI